MRAVVQRVKRADVVVEGQLVGEIGAGLLVLVGIEEEDDQSDIDWLTRKIVSLRIFNDHQGQMNKSIEQVKGDILVVSQFTLHASTKKGNRPSFIKAAKPIKAKQIYDAFVARLNQISSSQIKQGIFAANMDVSLCNSGPVTIIIDTKQKE